MVIWSRPAKSDLKNIHDFIAENSRHYAKKVVHEIREKADILNELPAAGRMVPEIGSTSIRELHIFSCRIMYEIVAGDVHVLAVIHKRSDFGPEDLP